MAKDPKAQAKALAESVAKAKAVLAHLGKVETSAKVAKGELEKESDEGSSEE